MTTLEQIPRIDEQLRKIDVKIRMHLAYKFRIQKLLKRLYKMMDYRDRKIRELGAERSKVATFELGL